MADTIPLYATGPDCVVHRTGARLGRYEVERIRNYHTTAINAPGASNERRQNNQTWLEQLQAAAAAAWPDDGDAP